MSSMYDLLRQREVMNLTQMMWQPSPLRETFFTAGLSSENAFTRISRSEDKPVDPKLYKQLQLLFAKRNDNIVKFYSDLLDVTPKPIRSKVLDGLGAELRGSSELYRTVCEELYKN